MLPEAVQGVYEALREAIIDESYPAGQPLPEMPLAEKYGVKRTRIRQILQRLERDGLIEIIPARGAFVKPISMGELQEIFELREALEGIAARLAARKRRDGELGELQAAFAGLSEGPAAERLHEKVRLGGELHAFILRSAGNRRIQAVLEPLQVPVARLWRQGILLSPERIAKAFGEHIAILAALQERDEALAERRMQAHVAEAFKDYIRVLVLNERPAAGADRHGG